jgi:hypothetical protein
MIVLQDLTFLWERRNDKPFIGVDHQIIPGHSQRVGKPFLNSGVQIVGDPEWYQYDKIEARYRELDGHLSVPGHDQASIYEYCKSIDYDYTHPDIGLGWNACAGYTKLFRLDDEWTGICKGLKDPHAPAEYQVYINHYWDEFKPWRLKCPIYTHEQL